MTEPSWVTGAVMSGAGLGMLLGAIAGAGLIYILCKLEDWLDRKKLERRNNIRREK